MNSLRSLVQALALALILSPALGSPIDHLEQRDVCNADNCLRAVRASAFPTRMGTQDCSSYFITTVTPALSTITSIASFSVTSIVIEDVTFSTVLPITTTAIISDTETDTVTATTIVSTLTPAIPGKRQVTVVPTVIPTYASACSGSIRYSSACSCIGVTATTVTLAIPLTTTTVSTTVPETTSTTLITVETDVETSIAETAYVTTDEATVTTTTTISATATAQPIPVCGRGLHPICCQGFVESSGDGDICRAVSNFNNGCASGYIPLCCGYVEPTPPGSPSTYGEQCVRASV